MILSMTGYGRKEEQRGNVRLLAEIRAVNHRYCEVITRLPKSWGVLEAQVKNVVSQKVRRGRVEVHISMEQVRDHHAPFTIDWTAAEFYAQAAAKMNEHFSLHAPLTAKDLLTLPGVVLHEEVAQVTPEEIEEWLTQVVVAAAADLYQMKQAEGERINQDLTMRLTQIQTWTDEILEFSPQATEEYQKRLTQRIQDLSGELVPDQSRLMQEVALFAERADISEETTRLASHCAQFWDQLNATEAVGRKLDFLLQEMNREANTIASKANHLPIQRLAVEIKTELEKMREQVQNVE
ncbi:YicC/YloC family endoribonuclease [Brevibacillus dissolubilis]|uniref:YicC/YloC family endoribonuclease n=1 Tax=Brevibacillus dissolubilis TaxID=1844116 RepID=UPI001116DFF9|nr:YicC/YloC family endoribonuclease [Brevibacillus dissolubilis]